jgi:hypothetical protein
MGDLHLSGVRIPVARGGATLSAESLGGGGYGVTGRPLGGHLATVEQGSITTPVIPLAEAHAMESLCREGNGVVWHCTNSIYGSPAVAMIDTPTFQGTTTKFGTHAISVTAAAGDVDVVAVGSRYTVAAWTKVGAGDWEHHILRSDGAKWVDGVRNDSATLQIAIDTGIFELLDDGAATVYFDELVYLPFRIADGWGADWPLTVEFGDLPGLDVTGDMLSGYRIPAAKVRARLSHEGYVASFSGLGAVVQLDITGPEREDIT